MRDDNLAIDADHNAGHGSMVGLRQYVAEALGGHGPLITFQRSRGGAKKSVYHAAYGDGFRAVVYVWDPSENYSSDADWICGPQDGAAFGRAQALLSDIGVRTPEVFILDSSRRTFPLDIAIVEEVPGILDEHALERPEGLRVLPKLGAVLRTMHAHRSPVYGPLESPAQALDQPPPEDIILSRALDDLREATGFVSELAEHQQAVADLLRQLRARIAPRQEYGLIHGEMGPGHVLLDVHGDPVIIDIEGVHYFDIELEHAYLALRFADHYRELAVDGLDRARLDFYLLFHHVSISAGFVTLLRRGYPDRDFCMNVLNGHVRWILEAVAAAR